MDRNSGFTLLELLVTLAVLGILLGIGIWSLLGLIQRQRLVDDAFATANAFRFAVARVRERNTAAAVTFANKLVTVSQGGTTVKQINLNYDANVICPSTCPTGNTFVVAAPYGRSDTDFSVTFTAQSLSRTVYIRGPLGWVNVE